MNVYDYIFTNQTLTCVTPNGFNSCAIVVSQCDVDIRHENAASKNIDFAFVSSARDDTPPPPRPEPRSDGPIPQLSPGAERVTGFQSRLSGEGVGAWQRALAAKGVAFDMTPLSSPQITEAFADRSAPWAITPIPLNRDEQKKLAKDGITYTYVPVGISSLAVAVGMQYASAPITEVTLPAETLARMFRSSGDIAWWTDPSITELNDGCQFSLRGSGGPNLDVHKFYRGDASAANQWFTTYLNEVRPDLAVGVIPGVDFPTSGSGKLAFQTNDEMLEMIYRGKYFNEHDFFNASDKIDSDSSPRGGRMGFVEHASALDYHLTIATISNAKGERVRPTPEAIVAGIEDPPQAGPLEDEDVFFPDFDRQPADAYPMPIVFYALVPTSAEGLPTTPAGEPDYAWAQRLVGTLGFIVSDEGQKAAAQQGWVALPKAFQKAALRGIAAIPTKPGPAQPSGSNPGQEGSLGSSGSSGSSGSMQGGGDGIEGLGGGFGDATGGFGGELAGGAIDSSTFGDDFDAAATDLSDAVNTSSTSGSGEDDAAGAESSELAASRLGKADLTPTVTALGIAAGVALFVGRVLTLSARRGKRRKAGPDKPVPAMGAPQGATPAGGTAPA